MRAFNNLKGLVPSFSSPRKDRRRLIFVSDHPQTRSGLFQTRKKSPYLFPMPVAVKAFGKNIFNFSEQKFAYS
jgi:hypothetical protein